MTQPQYEAPKITSVGSLHKLTLISNNKYQTKKPDGVIFHPETGGSIPLSS